jgi:hypothetical protein
MRWRVLVIRRWTDPLEPVLEALKRAGITGDCERVDTEPAMLAALEREEWELVIYDPETRNDIPIERVYTHAPASAIVIMTDPAEMADEITRLVAARIELTD